MQSSMQVLSFLQDWDCNRRGRTSENAQLFDNAMQREP